jgi:hypothetical protein
MVRIYDMGPYREKVLEEMEGMPEFLTWSERLHYLGFKSCRFVLSDIFPFSNRNDYWEMDDIEYTWFVLRFS